MNQFKRVSTTAERLKSAMDESGKKQIDLVNETGLNKSTISRYLRGEYEPKQDAIYKLSIALDCSEMWLWGYDVPKERPAEQKEIEKKSSIPRKDPSGRRTSGCAEDILRIISYTKEGYSGSNTFL